MTQMYATITSKGQVTLPAAARRALGLHEGQKISIRVEGDSLVIARPRDIESVRAKLREEAEARGTWGRVPTSGDGWTSRAGDLSGDFSADS